jgi:hypothetical protein
MLNMSRQIKKLLYSDINVSASKYLTVSSILYEFCNI